MDPGGFVSADMTIPAWRDFHFDHERRLQPLAAGADTNFPEITPFEFQSRMPADAV
jgi:hypothetical protein